MATQEQNPVSSNGVSTNLPMHVSSQSECYFDIIISYDDFMRKINELICPQTLEQCQLNMQNLEAFYQRLDPNVNAKEANFVAFSLYKLANRKSDFLLERVPALTVQMQNRFSSDCPDSESDSSIHSCPNEDNSKTRVKNRPPLNNRQSPKKHKNRDTNFKLNSENNLKLANRFSPIAPDDVEPDMEMSNEDEDYVNAKQESQDPPNSQ
ncbi:hypothetical protein AVEN_170071-1 [Araneus ventricosus]|uniref:Uncharacterized protein n=1 Tax=Araneus ventricosus TaxID=182803 RepID=A0A4Y2SU34_ARAVE|nr:hypothetical protein AVEN_170071-1 [Araneus ventricosus]